MEAAALFCQVHWKWNNLYPKFSHRYSLFSFVFYYPPQNLCHWCRSFENFGKVFAKFPFSFSEMYLRSLASKDQNDVASSRDANTSRGSLAREFSRGNYFSFKRDGRISPQSASHVSRSAISPGILILSYYLISSVTRTNAVPPRSANWLRHIPSMFLPPSPSSICAPAWRRGTNVFDRGPEGECRFPVALLVRDLSRYGEWNTAEPPVDIRRSKTGRIAENPNREWGTKYQQRMKIITDFGWKRKEWSR